jgi:hypothetical protein
MQSKSGAETKAAGAEGNLTTVPSELSRVVDTDRGRGVGQPKGQPLFLQYISADNRADNEQIYLFCPDDNLSKR